MLKILERGEAAQREYLAAIRWGCHGENKQVCPTGCAIDTHYWCESVKRWKCRDKTCGKQFSLFSGTRFHNMKMSLQQFIGIMFQFVEAKDSVSSRELSGLYDLNHQSAHVATLKIREAIRETMSAEPLLDSYVQADAAYFMKYLHPGNIATGASLAGKRDQKNAGLNENGKVPHPITTGA